jgi:predicted dehydrogenase
VNYVYNSGGHLILQEKSIDSERRLQATCIMLNVAVVGGGGLIGKRHCQHVLDNTRTNLCAITDPSDAASAFAKDLDTVCYKSVAELLESPHRPDAAIVCTPNHTHVEVGIQLARAGVHILCEKPISTDQSSASSLVKAVEECNVKLLVGHHRRFSPYMRALKQVVESGVLGQIIAVNGLWTTIKPPEYFQGINSWRRDKASGGPILINLIHDVDLMHFLFGPISSVHAERTPSQRSNGIEAAEEGAAALFKFESGLVGTFLISDNVASPHSFEQGTGENPHLPKTGKDFYRIFGSRGTVSFPDMTLSSYEGVEASWNNVMTSKTLPVEGVELAPLAAQLDHFVDVCAEQEPSKCTGVDGMRALAVCEAVRRALETGAAVNVELSP